MAMINGLIVSGSDRSGEATAASAVLDEVDGGRVVDAAAFDSAALSDGWLPFNELAHAVRASVEANADTSRLLRQVDLAWHGARLG